MHHIHYRQSTPCTYIHLTLFYLASNKCEPNQYTSNMFNMLLFLVPMHSSLLYLSTAYVFGYDEPDQFCQTIYLSNKEDSNIAINPHHHRQMAGGSHCNVNHSKNHYQIQYLNRNNCISNIKICLRLDT